MASTGMKTMRVLVTRPWEDCARTAEALAKNGHTSVLAPLFEVRKLSAGMPDAADAVLAASANALRMAEIPASGALHSLPLFAVGSQTAAEARRAGFQDVRTADGDAAALARLVRGSMAPGSKLLHLAGRPRRDEAIEALGDDFRITVAETYETAAVETLPATAAEAIRDGNLDAVLHFSPRAAKVFGDLAAKAGVLAPAIDLLHVFISTAAADPRLPNNRIARKPDLESVVAAL
jgi:uroporphyrinogen-III synthase